MNTDEIILEELREFHKQVQPWMVATGERVTTLEANSKMCSQDNADVEERLRDLEQWHWKTAGVASFVSALVAAIVGLFLHH